MCVINLNLTLLFRLIIRFIFSESALKASIFVLWHHKACKKDFSVISNLPGSTSFMDEPLVTILISSYNQRDFIEAAIVSALNQDYPNIEIIVIDDASTDGSQKIIERFSLGDGSGRMRMISTYYFANQLSYLVAGTGNKSEDDIGYFTKYGDGGVDFLPIQHLYKHEVRQLARYLKLPEKIVTRTPTAGLWEG